MNPKRPFTEEDWQATPKSVQDFVMQQESTIQELRLMVSELTKRIEKLENQLNKNSRNSNKPPSNKKWTACYSELILNILLFEGADDDAGKLAKRLSREIDHLFTFLEEQGVEPTNNGAERAIRFGILWRKRSMGTQSDKGDRWVERILSFKQTCKLKAISSFDILLHLIESYFKDQVPCLDCLA